MNGHALHRTLIAIEDTNEEQEYLWNESSENIRK